MFLCSLRHTGAANALAPSSHEITLGLLLGEDLSPGPSPCPDRGTHTRHQLPLRLSSILPREPRSSLFLSQFCDVHALFPLLYLASSRSRSLAQLRAHTEKPGSLGSNPASATSQVTLGKLAPDMCYVIHNNRAYTHLTEVVPRIKSVNRCKKAAQVP